MSIHVPGVGDVPIVWLPASTQDYAEGRFGYQPVAIVHHRAVAGLDSVDSTFATDDADRATVGSPDRLVSSHFGIGNDNGQIEIHQYVNLSDTAYCNGDYHPDGKWDEWFGAERVALGGGYSIWNTNPMTVSIEHDDNGGSADPDKRGLVTEKIIKTSIELDRLMLTGDIDKMRAAGIRIREDTTATALGKIPIDRRHLIDHHDIAGPNKPTCWRPWAADEVGFPRQRYIESLTEPAPTPAPDPTPYSQADLDAAVTAATAPLQTTIDNLIHKNASVNELAEQIVTITES